MELQHFSCKGTTNVNQNTELVRTSNANKKKVFIKIKRRGKRKGKRNTNS